MHLHINPPVPLLLYNIIMCQRRTDVLYYIIMSCDILTIDNDGTPYVLISYKTYERNPHKPFFHYNCYFFSAFFFFVSGWLRKEGKRSIFTRPRGKKSKTEPICVFRTFRVDLTKYDARLTHDDAHG